MRPVIPILAAALLWAAQPSGLPADQAGDVQSEVAFQAAIKTETIDGDLKGAILQYQKLANGGQRAVAAKALVRLGQCYEKLGDPQSRRAYERVAREFADQKEAAAAARARLAALSPQPGNLYPVMRRVWAGPEVNAEGAPSWDGRYLSFTNQATANIALRDLATGETRDLTKNSDRRQHPADRSIISPEGKQVAYAWITEDVFCDLRLIGTDGFGQRVLYRDEHLSGIELGAWSPDGARLAAAFTARDKSSGIETNQIASISVVDGSVRILKTAGSRRPHPRAFSPDGRFIVYDYPPREDSENRDIFLLAADGSQEVPLVQHPADDRLLGWAPDGKSVLFASDRNVQWGAWLIRVADGKPAGTPEPVKAELGQVEPLGFTQNGSFFYAVESGGTDAYTAALDPAAWQLLTAPARISERSIGTSQYPLFSPDGRSLAYFSNRTGDRWLLYIRSPQTGEERVLPVPSDLESLRTPRWTANGQALFVSGSDKAIRHVGLYMIDARTGDSSPILSSNPEADRLGGRSTPDGKSLFLTRAGFASADKAALVLRRDWATGSERDIYHAPAGADINNLTLSPDGQALAFTIRSPAGIGSSDGLWTMTTQGADAHEILRLNGRETIRRDGLVWTPDGQYLLFAKAIEIARFASRLELWRISPRDQEPRKIGLLASDMAFGDGSSGLGIHPDGKSIVFHAGPRRPEVWRLENFQPAPKNDAFLDILHELTMEAWIKTSRQGPSLQVIMAKGGYTYDGVGYALFLNAQGRLQCGVRHTHTYYGESGDWSIDGIMADTALQADTWYHVVGVVYSSKSVSIYVNGTLVKTGAITQSILSRPNEPLRIGSGSNYGQPDWKFDGSIDEVAIYDRALSADEIQQRHQAGIQRHKD
ncbi:MAG: sialidase domain-containing protein [Acidobacteriota bacterium]|nr:sialidase domain-containing protein [Acidobacteriota bacterium]